MKKIYIILLIVCVSICLLISGFFIGRALPRKNEIGFYANVLENKGTYLLVEGIPENDINHRSQFTVSLKDKNNKKSILNKDSKPISFSDIPEECLVNIIYDGVVLETSPAQINGVILIQIIE